MKRKTIIGLVLAAGLLLIGAVAYGSSNGYGDQGYYARGCLYGGGYGRVCGVVYNKDVNHSYARADVPYCGYRRCDRYWNTRDHSRNYANDWAGCRRHGRSGPRGWR